MLESIHTKLLTEMYTDIYIYIYIFYVSDTYIFYISPDAKKKGGVGCRVKLGADDARLNTTLNTDVKSFLSTSILLGAWRWRPPLCKSYVGD